MFDEPGTPEVPPAQPVQPLCPWCSAPLPDAAAERCSACGARLVEATTVDIPGVTTIDPSLLRVTAAPPPKRGMLGALTRGDAPRAPEAASIAPSSPEALAPPSAAIRQEMRRLRAELEAAAAAEAAEAAEAEAAARDA